MDGVLTAKLVALLLLGGAGMFFGLLPLLIRKLAGYYKNQHVGKRMKNIRRKIDVILSCVVCMGGGILLATVFVHMLPELREVFEQIEQAELLPHLGVALGELVVCLGFLMVYFVEELAQTVLMKKKKEKPPGDHDEQTAPSSSSTVEAGDYNTTTWNENLHKSVRENQITPKTTSVADARCEPASKQQSSSHQHDHGADLASLHVLRAYMVVLALSVHSVFEGLAIGLQDTLSSLWLLLAGTLSHKIIVIFCVGEQLLHTKRSSLFIVVNIAIFAAASPLGIAIGIILGHTDIDQDSSLLATGFLQALAAGTLLYVTFFELLGPERQKPGPGLLKFLAVLCGFMLMIAIQTTAGHSHDHHSDTSAGLSDQHDHDHGHEEHH